MDVTSADRIWVLTWSESGDDMTAAESAGARLRRPRPRSQAPVRSPRVGSAVGPPAPLNGAAGRTSGYCGGTSQTLILPPRAYWRRTVRRVPGRSRHGTRPARSRRSARHRRLPDGGCRHEPRRPAPRAARSVGGRRSRGSSARGACRRAPASRAERHRRQPPRRGTLRAEGGRRPAPGREPRGEEADRDEADDGPTRALPFPTAWNVVAAPVASTTKRGRGGSSGIAG